MSEAFSVKRLPGSRTARDLMITSGKGSFQRLHRTFRRLRQKKATANEQDPQIEEETLENDVMDVEESLHQKPREVCLTEDTESIDLGWFENTKLHRVKNDTRCLLQVGVRDWESLGTSPSMIQKEFCETVAEVMDAEAEGEDDIHPSRRPRVAERVSMHVPPNPIVASIFGNTEEVERAAVRRGYPVMKSRFLNFGMTNRLGTNHGHDSEKSTPTFGFDISKPRWVAQSQLRHLSTSERPD